MTDRAPERQDTLRQHRWTVDSVSQQENRSFNIQICARNLSAETQERIAEKKPPLRFASFRTVCLIALVGVITLEAGSTVAYGMLTGAPLSYTKTHEEQGKILGTTTAPNAALASGDGEGKMTQFLVNPYTGYVRKADDPHAVAGQEIVLGKQPIIALPPADTAFIGIFGGSVAEQFAAGGSGSLRRILASDPRFSGKKIEIVTAAMAGYKQPQQLLALNYLLSLGQHFDMILNIDGFNEVAGPTTANMPKNVSPYFPSGWYHLADRLPDTAMLERIGSVAVLKEERRSYAKAMLSSPVLRWSATAQFLWKGFDSLMAKREADAEIALTKATATDDASLDKGLPYAYVNDDRLVKDLVDNWERSSNLMRQLASARGIPYLHFLQPNQYVAGSKNFTGQEKTVALNPYSPYKPWVERGYPLLAEAGKRLRKEGVDFHDLSAIFKRIPETVYKDDCCHVNAQGNDLMAEAVATAIAAVPLQPTGTFAAR